ncbi:hypothetical protein DI392_15955 [Vibrio albus]|jgi:endonuclease-3 related protein|uniref:Methylated-DNA--protein-cysteine methyltransferase n=1 Tax=Vibrio albus TaxID=2200953 RepID=A0A2U3B625_9VIBR|nr:methylated-DNA--[protein]-cysteine S-methyltransferase [Vibrio albus]PWI32174.1 hypothetical protein DI392_15955 [Vibrio albus]
MIRTKLRQYYDRFNTRIGPVVVLGDVDGLTHLFIDNDTRPVVLDPDAEHAPHRFEEVRRQLSEYLCGARQHFELRLAGQGTDFQQNVWKALTHIPYGQSASYKEIAIAVGNPDSSRAVGMANNKNPLPIIIPCHRVIGSNRKLTGYAFGLPAKQQLLELELINAVFDRLKRYYGEFPWWEAESPYEVMIGAVLTQNTNWKNVEMALDNLRGQMIPEAIEQMPDNELAERIRPSGFYNQKLVRLKALTHWFKRYGYDIEKLRHTEKGVLRKELLAISGVGPETADSILVYAIDKPSFVIDAYTMRIFSRIGLDIPEDYHVYQKVITRALPEDPKLYAYYHALLVEHAKRFCNKTPQCNECPVREICRYS